MSHQTFKVSIVINETVENFYIKHFIDDFQPVFQKFKSLVFQRNPAVNVSNLKIYWIDAENDKILISCEEDFRLFIEQGAGRKVFFSVKNSPQPEDNDDVAMEAEDTVERSKMERRARKSLIRDEEKQKRAAKRLAEKMRSAEEKLRSEEERRSKNPDKYERKSAERLERAKKRCDQIRQIIGAIDPANLSPSSVNAGASTSSAAPAGNSIDESFAVLHPSAETIRLLSTAIAGCLQPCNLINKILNEIIGMVPQPTAPEPTPLNDQQQQTEVPPKASAATNTSNAYTPVVPTNPSSQEIEALFKEAAKELEKMNEIVNNSRSTSLASSMTGTTQIERVFSNITDSAISNATIVNNEDDVDASHSSPAHDFNIVTPPKSMRSRESSIEVHDVNSMMSDDSRDWTILDQEDESIAVEASGDQEEKSKPAAPASIASEIQDASAKFIAEEKESIKSVETQTPPLVLSSSASSSMSQAEVQASIRASIESVGKMNDIVKNSIASAQHSLQNIQAPVAQQAVLVPVAVQTPVAAPVAAAPVPTPAVAPPAPVQIPPPAVPAKTPTLKLPVVPPRQAPTAPAAPAPIQLPSATTPANLMANRLSSGATPKPVQPAVIVYDPNPKINAAVHQMVNMGFTNEGGWLTQLLLNVDGDVAKAINFLTPQPKPNQGRIVLNFD